MNETCRVRVRGRLDRRWSDWLGGLSMEQLDDGTTMLVGPVADQAALFGVIAGVRDLGLALVSVSCEAAPLAGDPVRVDMESSSRLGKEKVEGQR